MKILLFILLGVTESVGLGATTDGPAPNPIASLLPFALMGLVIYFIVRRKGRRSKQSKLTDAHRQRPPTERQIA